jgi:phosphoribosylformylglycinamidine synthase subunit PurQ / glutaminase
MKPRALVLQAYGSNRDFDVSEALTLAGAEATGIPLNELRMNKMLLSNFQLLVIPGGFSYADAFGAGKLLALDLISYFADEISAFVESGKPVMGICNGFQALVKSGILPGNHVIARRMPSSTTLAPHASAGEQSPVKSDVSERGETLAPHLSLTGRCQGGAHRPGWSVPGSAGVASGYRPRNDGATLTFNAQGHFECRWVTLKPISENCIWTKDLDELIECPVAHGEGNFQTSEIFPLPSFIENDQIALTYTCSDGSLANGEYPINPNGSLLDIAGICNPPGNVLGLMPHPENHIHPHQHPQWTRGMNHHSGLALFKNGVKYVL